MMDSNQYFARWDVHDARDDRSQPSNKSQTTAPIRRTVDHNYTRRVLPSGCVLIGLTERVTPIAFVSEGR